MKTNKLFNNTIVLLLIIFLPSTKRIGQEKNSVSFKKKILPNKQLTLTKANRKHPDFVTCLIIQNYKDSILPNNDILKFKNIKYLTIIGLGALSNVSDTLAGFNPTTLENRIEDNPPNRDFGDNPTPEQRKIDWVSHEQLSDPITGKPVIDWGPTESGVTPNEWGHGKLLTKTLGKPVKVNGVNRGTLDKYVGWLEGTDYNTYFNNCSQAAARGLTLSGVPVIGFHPWVLQASLYSRSIGIRPSLFLWEYNNYYHY